MTIPECATSSIIPSYSRVFEQVVLCYALEAWKIRKCLIQQKGLHSWSVNPTMLPQVKITLNRMKNDTEYVEMQVKTGHEQS